MLHCIALHFLCDFPPRFPTTRTCTCVIHIVTQAYTSVIFIVIYVAEVVLGVIAYTCILHPKGYLRRGWTTLDIAVILFG